MRKEKTKDTPEILLANDKDLAVAFKLEPDQNFEHNLSSE